MQTRQKTIHELLPLDKTKEANHFWNNYKYLINLNIKYQNHKRLEQFFEEADNNFEGRTARYIKLANNYLENKILKQERIKEDYERVMNLTTLEFYGDQTIKIKSNQLFY